MSSSAATRPEPEGHLLDEAKAKMRETGASIVIATDGDA